MHGDAADAGQGDGAWPVAIADADRRTSGFGVFVAQPKRRHRGGLLLEPREPDPLALAFPGTRIRPGFQSFAAVDGGFFEHLLTPVCATTDPS
ncbi:hypothetical protein [[Mycobacterium] nativiensis]|uniref:Uncharacterized protein n=1 Tax=[Mycobacterium] nativiensis TaxID=2855503 RepID=A0ABU5XUX5_9MYCO|nr:hypothetical protein [Mycolicibacter sp. MYC340]MEB3031728.1 hypothetical protein [Mycolicibacter sp. MYC340]